MKNAKFKWIEFCPEIDIRGEMLETGEELRKRRITFGTDRPMFISRYFFESPTFRAPGKVLSNFYADFDCEEDPQSALGELLHAANYFVENGVDEDKLKLRFTGGKGGSIEVPYEYFEAKPSEILPQVWKKIAQDLKKEKRWKTLDLSVYDKTRLWRLTNTKHKSGRYKIPITMEDLRSKKLEKICEMAQKTIEYEWVDDRDVVVSPISRLRAAYEDAVSAVNKEARAFKKGVKERAEGFGEIFPCVDAVIGGGVDAEEFQRNPTAFNIAVALCQIGLSDDEIMSRLVEFAGNCRPPMPEDRHDELTHCIEMARGHDYVTHCGTPVFEAHCVGKTKCWVFQKKDEDGEDEEEATKDEEFDADTVAKAQAFLNDPMNVLQVEDALSDVVKENIFMMSLFILIVSGQSVQVGGESSTGKSHMTDVVLACFPKKWIKMLTGVSDRTIRYLAKDIKILYIKEMKGTNVGTDKESSAEFDIKQGISEGQLDIDVTIKDPKTGKFKTQNVKTKFGCFISTTTDVGIAPELQNRMWEITTKDSISREVAHHIIKQASLPEDERTTKEPERKIIRCAMEIMDAEAPNKFIIPYPETLIKIMDMFGNQPRIRRDASKLLKVIQGFAKLNYRNRPVYESKNTKSIVCMPIDLYWAVKYLWPAILGTFSGSTKRSVEVWEAVKKITDAGKRLDSTALCALMDITQSKAGEWLKRFANEGRLTEGIRNTHGFSYSSVSPAEHGGEKSEGITIPYNEIRLNYYEWVKGRNVKVPDEAALPPEYFNFFIFIPRVVREKRRNVEDLPDAPVQVTGMISGTMTLEQLVDDTPYGGVSTDICWTIIKGRRFYRCPKCHHRLHLSLVDDDLHCHNCGHVEHVEYGDPEEME